MIYNEECVVLDVTSLIFILSNIKKLKKIKYYYYITKIYPLNKYANYFNLNLLKLFFIKKINKNIKFYNIDIKKQYLLNWKSNIISIKYLKKKSYNIYNLNSYKSLNIYFKNSALIYYYKHRQANLLSAKIYKRLILKNLFKVYYKKINITTVFIKNIFNRLILLIIIILYALYPIYFFAKKIKYFRLQNLNISTIIFHPIIKSNTNNNNNIKNYIENEYDFFLKNFDNKKFIFYKNSIWPVETIKINNIIDKNKLNISIFLILDIFLTHSKSLFYLILSFLFNEKFYFPLFNLFALKEILEKKIELKNVSYKYEIIRDDYRANHILRYILNSNNNIYSIIIQHHIFPIEYPSIVFAKADNFLGISNFHELQYKSFYENIIPVTRINNFSNQNKVIENNLIVIYLPSFRERSGIYDQFENFFISFFELHKSNRLLNFKFIFKVKNLSQFNSNIDTLFLSIYHKIKKISEIDAKISFEDSESINNDFLYNNYKYHIVFGASFTIWELSALGKLIYVYPIKGFEIDFFRHYKNITLIKSFDNFIERLNDNKLSKNETLIDLNYDQSSVNFKTYFTKLINE